MKKYCWVYFGGGYELVDVVGVFIDHQKGLEFVADEILRGDPDMKDVSLPELYDEANSYLYKQEVLG